MSERDVLKQIYGRRTTRNIWRGLRDRKLNSLRGSPAFGEEIYSTLALCPADRLAQFEDGSVYQPPVGGMSYKTVEKFLNKASEIFKPENNGGAKSINIENDTLRYLHAYLFAVFPERVVRWKDFEAPQNLATKIQNLDDSFDVLKTNHLYGQAFKVFSIDFADHETHKQSANYNDFLSKTKISMIGCFVCLDVKDSVEDLAFYISPSFYEEIFFDTSSSQYKGKSDQSRHSVRGFSIVFKSKDFDPKYGTINTSMFNLDMRLQARLDGAQSDLTISTFSETGSDGLITTPDPKKVLLKSANARIVHSSGLLRNDRRGSALLIIRENSARVRKLYEVCKMIK